MKTKHTSLATVSLGVNASEEISTPPSTKNRLSQFIQLALVGSMLVSGAASATLLDHGPSDPTLIWPQWYRDNNGLAVGLCKSQVQSPNAAAGLAPMCFPPAFDPAGFVGNLGPEMFYNMVEFREKATGSDFKYRFLAGLESSYLPLGVPVHGTETVFARIRIALNFNDPAKNGRYVVTHPFGVEVFDNLQATNTQNLFGVHAAVFFTADVPLAAIMNFDLALGGALGPFIQWDVLNPGESLTVGGQTFLGDPNYPHTFTGSPFGTNFIRIDGPPGSNLDGQGNDFIQTNVANVLGQVWGAPIAQPLGIDGAYETRLANGVNSIDVWATSSSAQRLVLTGTGMPSLQMIESSAFPGKYHGHIEYTSTHVPADVTVTNLASTPVNSTTAPLKDGVEISEASFNTNTRVLTVVAQSSDQIDNPGLVVEGIPGVPSAAGVLPAVTAAMTQAACPATATNPADRCFTYTLPNTVEPPENVSVSSTDLGVHADHLVSIIGAPQNAPNPPVATDFLVPGFSVNTGGSTTLTSAAGSLPLDALIIKQPATGTIALVNGVWRFTANAGVTATSDSFQYIRQAANNAPVSNVANGNLTLVFNATAPTAVADQFAATTAGTVAARTRKLFILSNDQRASANGADALDPASVTIVTPPSRGTAVKNADGTVSYTANSAGSDSFTYSVKNSATPANTSNIATVQLTNFTATESVTGIKSTYTISSNKWVITGSTSWFGPNLTTLTASCWMGTGATATATTLIGGAPIDGTGKFQIASTTGPVGVNNGSVTCQTSSGGKGVGTTTAK